MISTRAVDAFLAEIEGGARRRPSVTVWAAVRLDPTQASLDAARRLLSGYARARYDGKFALQGAGDVAEAAKGPPSALEVKS